VSCSFEIRGGLLALDEGGTLTLVQESTSGGWRLRAAVTGFQPRLAARHGRPRWTGALYEVQARLHAIVGRRFVARLVRGASR
jgi:hypothetical protein